jgi:hypothetical protein
LFEALQFGTQPQRLASLNSSRIRQSAGYYLSDTAVERRFLW